MSIVGTGSGGGGGGAASGDVVRTEIERITNATAGEFDFNSIPSGYDRLIIKGYMRSDTADVQDSVEIFLNEDLTPSNYFRQFLTAINNIENTPEGTGCFIANIPAATAPASSYCDIVISIENYDSSAHRKMLISDFGSFRQTTELYMGKIAVTSAITAAVTRVRLRTDNHATDQMTGTLILYGEKTQT